MPLVRPLVALFLAMLLAAPAAAQDERAFVDSAGREVVLPATISRVLAAGPPASTLLYTFAPELMVGWVRALRPDEKRYLSPSTFDLPEYGRLTGRGGTANLEVILQLEPDLILDSGSLDATYVSLADRVQDQTGIPYVLLDGAFEQTPETYRMLGAILGREERAEELAAYAEDTIRTIRERVALIPEDERPRVYYGRGPDGLETGLDGSINLEVLSVVGASNVAAAAGRGGLTNVSPEQILAWNPEYILTPDPHFYANVGKDPLFAGVEAVREGRIYKVPSLPYGWFDSPPGVNRLIGVHWLTAVLYPELAQDDLGEVTRDFYRRFYHVELDDEALADLLRDALAPPS